jgi:exosome complex RNA-binding protein Csl4
MNRSGDYIKAKLLDFQKESALLQTEDNQKIIWPKDRLPENIKVGDDLKLRVLSAEQDEIGKEELAKAILNQILQI